MAQVTVLESNCEVDGFNPADPPECSGEEVKEEGSIFD